MTTALTSWQQRMSVALKRHAEKWADLPLLTGRALPTPAGHPDHETTAELVDDLVELATLARKCIEAVPHCDWLAARLVQFDLDLDLEDGLSFPEWPETDLAADLLAAWRAS